MRNLPHDRRSIIFLSALEESLANSSLSDDQKNKLGSVVSDYFNAIEVEHRAPENIDERLAEIGSQLSHAVMEDRREDAEQLTKRYHQLADAHESAKVMMQLPRMIENHSVPGYSYRNWKGTKEGLSFGMIEAELDDNATIGIIGDWGTGTPDAQALLQELKTNHNPDIIIHLGDIYKCCRYDKDVIPNFINIIDNVYPIVDGVPTRPPVLTIPGNHDYMSRGGVGFFKLLDTINAHCPTWKQQASYFCLRTKSKKWQFLGADTGINDPSYRRKNEHPGLERDEYIWHHDKMDNFENKEQGRTIFMTHHPLFSATHPLEDGKYLNQHLASHFSKYLTNADTSPEIRLWMWGHNHWFIPYVNTAKVNGATLDKGRLLGGSARHDQHSRYEIAKKGTHVIDYTKDGKPQALVPDENNKLPNHTYSVIKLSDGDAEVTHYQTPSWHSWETSPVKTLPDGQCAILLQEYVLDTKPMKKYFDPD